MAEHGYTLGVDVGTTYTAAAVHRRGHPEMLPLGSSSTTMPTVVLLRDDGEVLVGEAAERRAVTEPSRIAREFKRRIGDPTPIVVGGTPYGAESLVAHVLRSVAHEARTRQGGDPDAVALTHPASWSTFKLDLLQQAARQAGLEQVRLVTEPEAAAIHYAAAERVEPGTTIAVYDLGGGTFDAALLRRTADGFAVVGVPEGMERFGGIDVDRALLAHVDDALGGTLAEHAAAGDGATAAGMARLRDDVRTAKEALSSDSDAAIPVLLPGLSTEVRITRAELETMIRPRLHETIEALHRCVRSAGMDWPDIAAILAVGGSSRIPLVRDIVRERTGRPVVVDAHPKHAIALGAATAASVTTTADDTAPVPPTIAPPVATTVLPPPAPVSDVAPPAAPAAARPPRRTALVAGGAVAAVAAAVLVGTTVLGGGSGDAAPATTAPATTIATTTSTAPPTTAPPTTVPTTPPTTATATAATTAPAATVPPKTAAPKTAAPATAPPVTAPAVEIVDDTGSFAVTLPGDAQLSTEPINLSGVEFAHVSASPNLASYLSGDWATFGFSVLVTDASFGSASSLASMLDPGAVCATPSGQRPYTGALGSGVIAEYDDCGGVGASQALIAVEVPAQGALVMIGIQGPGPAAGGLSQYAELIMSTVRAV